MPQSTPDLTPLPQPAMTATARRSFTIGLPLCNDPYERRFPLTPEAVRMLIDRGFGVRMQAGAAKAIHYTDEQYTRAGAEIVGRTEAMGCDIVIDLAMPEVADIRRMRRGAMLLTLYPTGRIRREAVHGLLEHHIISIAVDLICDERGNLPFADILSEIEGRAAIARASSLLADAIHGKGILLGGIAGVVPCEVTIIGSDIAARAAARSATGAGAQVRMFDDDVYRLRDAQRDLGPAVVGSALHPKVVKSALRSADVVVYTGVDEGSFSLDSDEVAELKRGVIIFDLSKGRGSAFPSLPTVDLGSDVPRDLSPTEATRVCYINAGSSVPRTAAMALSNTLLTLLRGMLTREGVTTALKLMPGLQRAVMTFMGKAVNPEIARAAAMRHVDINIFLTLS